MCARREKERLEGQHERTWLVGGCIRKVVPGNAAQSAGAPAAASMCKEGARARAGTPCLLLTAARVSSITRHRAAVLRVMQGEARAARAGEAFCACRVLLLPASAVVGKARLVASFVTRCCPFCSRTKFDFGFDSCSYRKFSYASVKRLRLSESVGPGVTMNLSARIYKYE